MLRDSISYFDGLLHRFSSRLGMTRLMLTPFFWLTIPPFQTSECSELFLDHYLDRPRLKKGAGLRRLFGRNIKDLLNAAGFGKSARLLPQQCFFGEFDSQADVYVQSWLYPDDFERFCNSQEERYWGNIQASMPSGKTFQFFVFPLYPITEEHVRRLVAKRVVVFNPHFRLSAFSILGSLYTSLRAFLISLPEFKSLSAAALFMTSLLNYRTLRSEKLRKIFEQAQTNPKAVVLLPWEGQPEQRAQCHAFRKKGVQVWGYIHSSATNNPSYLAKFQDEALDSYFPNQLLVHSSDLFHTLKEANWKAAELKLIHCLRFKPRSAEDFKGKLYLPYDIKASIDTLLIAKKLCEQGTIQVSSIAAHPMNREKPELKSITEIFPLSKESSLVLVGGFSAIILEALEAGCEVLHIAPEGVGSLDPCAYPSIERTPVSANVMRLRLNPDKRGALLNFGIGGLPLQQLLS